MCLGGTGFAQANPTVFSTGFETNENYDAGFELIGQNGWTNSGSAGNGLISRFPGEGQQAYIGFFDPLTNSETFLQIWRPINFDPLTNNRPVVTFRTTMEIVDSTSADPNRDDFRWSVLNTDGQHLLSLDFDNHTTGICYLLGDDTNFYATAFTFTNHVIYDIELRLDFNSNIWSAWVGSTQVLTNQPLAPAGAKRDIGDIAATWFFLNPDGPGDNAMVFDNYSITAQAATVAPPAVRLISLVQNDALVEVTGDGNRTYVIDGSSDLRTWAPLKTNTPTDGVFQFLDVGAATNFARYYRARIP